MNDHRVVTKRSNRNRKWTGPTQVVVVTFATISLYSIPAPAQDWIEFVEESCRIVADPSVGADDTQEKDIAVGDLDGDGDTDMVIVRKFPFSSPGGKRNVLLMNEDGIMVDRTSELAPGFLDLTDDRDVVIVDVDFDEFSDKNMPDIVTAITFGNQSGDLPRVYINLGCCNIACSPAASCPSANRVRCNDPTSLMWCGLQFDATENRIPTFTPDPFFCAVAAGDVTNDGCQDLYFVDYQNTLEDRLLINVKDAQTGRCTGTFNDETSNRLTPTMVNSIFGTGVQIIDINNDFLNDIVKSENGMLEVFYNDPNHPGHFILLQSLSQEFNMTDPYQFSAEDVNNDGRMDIYVVRDNQDSYLINTCVDEATEECNRTDGSAQFLFNDVTDSNKTTGFGGNVRLVDLDGDPNQTLDVVVSDVDVDIPGCARRLAALRTVVDPLDPLNVTISDPIDPNARPWNTAGTFDTGVLDIDGDSKPDLWSGTCSGNRLFIQDGADCNGNDIGDFCDLLTGTSNDCDSNEVPDECDLLDNPSLDCFNSNGIIDSCESGLQTGSCCFFSTGSRCEDFHTQCGCTAAGGFFGGVNRTCKFDSACGAQFGPQPGP